MGTAAFDAPLGGLPDPERDGQFYEGVVLRRFVAACLDALIVLAIGVPLATAFAVLTLGFGFAAFPLIVLGAFLLYRTRTLASASATWGMRFCGIEFRRGDGTRFDLATAFLHSLIQTIALAFFALQLLSCVTILVTRYGQSLPDLILGTTALHAAVD